MNRWDTESINYTDVDALRRALVGRSIVSSLSEGEEYNRVLTFVLDDGTALKAHAADGGCGCSNGCFSVEPCAVVKGTITNVEVKEIASTYDWEKHESIESEIPPGSISDGWATIRVFVYADLGEQLLIQSEGGDNGYYGWGFWLSVHPTLESENAR